jgi:hypothetical protein
MISTNLITDNTYGGEPQRANSILTLENSDKLENPDTGVENVEGALGEQRMFIDIRDEVVNYPVQVGGLVEVLVVSRRMEGEDHVVKFRLVRFCEVQDDLVVGVVIPEDISIEGVGADDGWLVHFSYGDVCLPVIYLCMHPIAL